ncbi:hypothetical protein [Ramlibacter sp.]|uniref:hypothetical protein n=1 Tax=Ramlibacter sp. TaxID=1917967 RepID=UPI0035AF3747
MKRALLAAACLMAVSAMATPVAVTPGAQAATTAPMTRAATVRLAPMIAFDGVYIPALSQTSNASQKPEAGPAATAAMARLRQAWPALRENLAGAWGASAPAGWAQTLERVDQQIAQADRATASAKWHDAHEALEEVRLVLMRARVAGGLDYFVDRLTAYHEPMEVIALTGAQVKPADLDATRLASLRNAFTQASELWQAIRRVQVDPVTYALDTRRAPQLSQGLTDEDAALQALGSALAGTDASAILRAAAAVKPPFARVFTAFGQP